MLHCFDDFSVVIANLTFFIFGRSDARVELIVVLLRVLIVLSTGLDLVESL